MQEYGYLNVRLRVRKKRLIDAARFESLAKTADTTSFGVGLLSTDYKPDLEWGRLRYPGIAGLEEGLRHHVTVTVQKVGEFAKSTPEAMAILRVLTARWDMHNLRALLRGHHIHATGAEIRESFVPVGELDESQLMELSNQPSLKAMIDLLSIWKNPYAEPLITSYAKYLEKKDLSIIELKLDQFHYSHLLYLTRRRIPGIALLARLGKRHKPRPIGNGLAKNVALVREVIRKEIDVTNLVTVLRLRHEKLDQEAYLPFYIPGGITVTQRLFTSLAGKSVDQIVERLSGTPYADLLQGGMEQYRQRKAVSVLERRLEEYLIRDAVGLFGAGPLGSPILIAFIYAKFNELVNLRILARGKEAKIAEDRIREALIIV